MLLSWTYKSQGKLPIVGGCPRLSELFGVFHAESHWEKRPTLGFPDKQTLLEFQSTA